MHILNKNNLNIFRNWCIFAEFSIFTFYYEQGFSSILLLRGIDPDRVRCEQTVERFS